VLKVAVPPLTDDDLPNIDPTDPVEEYEEDDYIDIVLTVRPWIMREQGGDLK
jgi:DNA-directed RNA polymerase subunit H (RpoH/RPB5)